MFVVHGTKKFLDRVAPSPPLEPAEQSTTRLGAWYATVLFWQPQVALFVNELTLLPLLVPLAPAATVINRMPQTAAAAFAALGLSEVFIALELSEMSQHRVAKTNNRSVLGSMNDFAYLADAYRTSKDAADLVALSLRLAQTPCSPLYRRHISPYREVVAYIGEQTS